jgi:hypothetical protein
LTILRKGRQDTREGLHYRRRRDDCNCPVQTTAQQIFNANVGLWMFSAAPVLQGVVLDVNNNLADTVNASSVPLFETAMAMSC